MTIMKTFYDYSQLSMASYSTKIGTLSFSDALIDSSAGFVQAQADQLISEGWEVVSQSSDALYGSSGFSATLFHNTQTGEYVFANRGTAGFTDLAFADAWGIVIQGMAGSQIIDMYRFYKQLITPQGQHVVYSADELFFLNTIKNVYSNSVLGSVSDIINLTQNDLGVGGLSADQAFTTTGHSLGGHLSLWLDKLVPVVSHVYTYNGAGNGGFFQSAVTTVAGTLTGTPFSLSPDSGTTNVFGYGGPAIISGVGGNVGENIPVDIEFKDPIDSVLSDFYNHSIVQLTDAMAVVNLFNKLDVGITTERFNDLFLKGSNEIGLSLEGLLDGLRSFFGNTDSTPNDNRDQFYINLYDLQNSTAFKSLIGKVTITTPPSTASEARNDFGAFLSLIYLTPFALKANDIMTAVLLQTSSLTNTELALRWEQDKTLTPEQLAGGAANYSDQWLADRAHMLAQMIQRNSADSIMVIGGGINESYQDLATGQMFWTAEIGFYPGPGLPPDSKHYVFGDANANPDIQGGTNADHLYGGAGDDVLNGYEGNDYLEGGMGVDTLIGGKGDDTLLGGAGSDTYIYNSFPMNPSNGDGFDTIIDADGQGSLTYDGVTLSGGSQYGGTGVYRDANKHLYVVTDQGLLIDGNLLIKNYKDGDLNITLSGSAPPEPGLITSNVIIGDLAPLDIDPNTDGVQAGHDANDNLITDPSKPEPGRADILYDSAGNDHIISKDGDDIINAFRGGGDLIEAGTGQDNVKGGAGNDVVMGEAGHDILNGEVGDDVLIGGADSDILLGSEGDDRLYADEQISNADAIANGDTQASSGAKGDWLTSGNGDDTLIGSTGSDVLMGGDGQDLLIGGAGDDDMMGDVDYETTNFYWSGTRPDDTSPTKYTSLISFTSVVNAPGYGADLIYAGVGNDNVWGGRGNDVIFGGVGNDNLYGGTGNNIDKFGGNDVILGGAGDDGLWGEMGDDFLNGGIGNDTLQGGEGSDIYQFDRGWGQDSIDNYDLSVGKQDTIEFGAGILASDITIARNNNDLILTMIGTTDRLSVLGYFDSDATGFYKVEAIKFADGLVWNVDAVKAKFITPSSGDDTLIGYSTADIIDGGDGNDFIYGRGGNDTLKGGMGDDRLDGEEGDDVLDGGSGVDYLAGGDGNDILYGGDGNEQFLLGFAGNDTIYGGAGDDALAGMDGDDLLDGGIGNDALYGNTGNDRLFGGDGNDSLTGDLDNQIGNDILDGGSGDDYLVGGAGSDIYLFNRGYGWDEIYNYDITVDKIDTIQFAEGISPSDIKITRGGNQAGDSLILSIMGTTDSLWVVNYFLNDGVNPYKVEQIRFSDGTVWDVDMIKVIAMTGTNTNDILLGYATADTIYGLEGDDTLRGNAGNDYLYGGAGNDSLGGDDGDDIIDGNVGNDNLNGGNGNDLLQGADGSDQLYGEDGNDILDGGAGNDYLGGGKGSDIYQFGRGSGTDGIFNDDSSLGKLDAIQFADDILTSDIKITRENDNLVLSIIGTTDKLRVANYFLDDGTSVWKIEEIRFANGVVWGVDAVKAMAITGTEINDYLIGYASGDTIDGLAGYDQIYGRAGNDNLNGGAGTDFVFGEEGDDQIDGGLGIDFLYGGNGYDNITGGAGNDYIYGENGNDALYGETDDDYIYGGIGDDVLDGGTGNDRLYGGIGNDLYVVDSGWDWIVEEFNEGTDTIQSSTTNGLWQANVENLTLTGMAAINGTGNSLDNVLIGNSAANILNGDTGADTLIGGKGNDTYIVDNSLDVVIEALNEGTDIVQSSVTFTLSANVENLILAGATAINGTGSTDNNTLFGNSADNILDGGAGADILIGRLGNDTYIVDNSLDIVIEATNEDTSDTIQSSISYTLVANIENLTLTGTLAIYGAGNSLDNVLTGNGAGSTLAGDAGNDTYVVGTGDIVAEALNKGIDTVLANITYTLSGNVENLTLTGAMDINGTGNSLDNILTGNDGVNTLAGGAGNDTYVVGTGDIVTEAHNKGIDTVLANITYTLSRNVENLTLTGTMDIDGTGNSLDNILTGNDGINTLAGGAGDDIYVIGTGDRVIESAHKGIDTVQSNVSYTLAANVENLTLLGTMSINGTGNSLDNVLTGNSAANILSGGAGADSFVFNNALNAIDTISDFNIADDFIRLDKAIFSQFSTAGKLALGSFVAGAGATALDSNDYLIYDTADGILYYDSDGNGAAKQVAFASLTGIPTLTEANFVIA